MQSIYTSFMQDNSSNKSPIINSSCTHLEPQNDTINYISINQDQNCIALGTNTGFKIFSTSPIQLFYEVKCGAIKIVEMLYTSNLILLVGLNEIGDYSPRKATIYKTNDNTVICSFWPFSNNITLAKLNKQRIILIEGSNIHIYSTMDMKLLHTIDVSSEILPNYLCLSPSSDVNNFLVYSVNDKEGIVKVYDLLYLTYKSTFQAHQVKIEKMNINYTGDKLITCSTKGTILRIFSLPEGTKLFTFKRGMSYAEIYSINFCNDDKNKVVLSSQTGTIHILDLSVGANNIDVDDEDESNNNNSNSNVNNNANNNNSSNKGWMNYLSNIKNKFVPKNCEDMINYIRPIISVNFNEIKTKNIIAFKGGCTGNKIFAVNEKGYCYFFNVNYKGNTMNKLQEYNLMELSMIEK